MDAERADLRAPSTWVAVMWAESFTVLALGLIAYGFLRTIVSCLDTPADCSAGDPTSGSGPLLVAVGLAALAGAIFVAARLSRQSRAFASGMRALLALLVALGVGATVFNVVLGDFAPALVGGLAAGAVVAVRAPSSAATRLRLVLLGLLVAAASLFAGANADGAIVVLALLVFPAVGIADSLAAGHSS